MNRARGRAVRIHRVVVLTVSLSQLGFMVEASAEPRSRMRLDPVEAHRAAARALLAAGDLDGAWLELSAAYRQSCDAKLETELATVAAKRTRTIAYPMTNDALLPVPTLLTIRVAPTQTALADQNGLVPFHAVFRTLDEGDDRLVPYDILFGHSRSR